MDPGLAAEKRGQVAMMEITRIDVQERSEVATGEADAACSSRPPTLVA
jgi:hypothetical protein